MSVMGHFDTTFMPYASFCLAFYGHLLTSFYVRMLPHIIALFAFEHRAMIVLGKKFIILLF